MVMCVEHNNNKAVQPIGSLRSLSAELQLSSAAAVGVTGAVNAWDPSVGGNMPEVPRGAPQMSRKRGAEPGPLPEHVAERKKACWGILTSQGRYTRLCCGSKHRLFMLLLLLLLGRGRDMLQIVVKRCKYFILLENRPLNNVWLRSVWLLTAWKNEINTNKAFIKHSLYILSGIII